MARGRAQHCAYDGCDGPDETRGYCVKHYTRLRRANRLPKLRRTRRTPIAERFWQRVTVGPEDQCWEWQGPFNHYGYGLIGDALGTPQRAHRVSYEIHKGPIPDGLVVMHSCDNPPCVNPAHLSVGTVADNNWDRARKGRTRGPWSAVR